MNGESIKILLVEDNAGDARLLVELLKETGESSFALVHAYRLSEALSLLADETFGVILLDLSLPDAHGLETLNRLQRQVNKVPIVVLTGLNDEEIALKAVEQGAQDFLIKGQVDGHLLARSLRYAIQRHRAEESLKERNRELLILRKISETILGSLDLRVVLDKILEEVMASASFDVGNIRLLDSSGQQLEVVATRGYEDPQNAQSHRKIHRTVEGEKSSFGDRLFTEPCLEEQVDSRDGYRTLKKEGVKSLVMVPVRANGDVLGAIQLASRSPRQFRPEEIRLLETIGNQMGLAVQKARLHEETIRQACELEKASQTQADFAAMIAHDLRSPLVNITGTAEVMMEGMFGSVNEDQKKWLSKILSNGNNLVRLVSDFLDVSKLEAGCVEVNKQTVDLEGLIQKNLENFLVMARDKKITLRAALGPSVSSIHADPGRLEQVLGNLISNAIKFTASGGTIEVGAAPLDSTQINLWVKDDGVGIPSEEIDLLFQKYRQCGNSKGVAQKGTGLGLVICKMIVEAHGGRIWVESVEGQGSTFYFSLPIRC